MISEKPEKKFDGFGVSSVFVGESVGESVDWMVRKWVIMVPGIFRVVGVENKRLCGHVRTTRGFRIQRHRFLITYPSL